MSAGSVSASSVFLEAAEVARSRAAFDALYGTALSARITAPTESTVPEDEPDASDDVSVVRQGYVYDFTQWTSSFDMQQIPVKHMLGWIEQTGNRIWSLIGENDGCDFLDVGCGTGLLLIELLRRCDVMAQRHGGFPQIRYVGADLSAVCIDALRRQVDRLRVVKKEMAILGTVKLFCATADEVLRGREGNGAPPSFDVIAILLPVDGLLGSNFTAAPLRPSAQRKTVCR
jgi:SAM-dependent methyltransferase